jgi:hypothetical protein
MENERITLAKETFLKMLTENRLPLGNNVVQIISYITKVIERTSLLILREQGKKLTGREKYDLCCQITEYCILKLKEKNIISSDAYDRVMVEYQNARLYADLVGGIISIAKESLTSVKCCC